MVVIIPRPLRTPAKSWEHTTYLENLRGQRVRGRSPLVDSSNPSVLYYRVVAKVDAHSFICALSVASVKVVRHKEWIFCCGRLWKTIWWMRPNPHFSRKGRARNGAPSGSSLDGKQKTREFPRFSANRPGRASQRQTVAHLGVKPRCVTNTLANRRETLHHPLQRSPSSPYPSACSRSRSASSPPGRNLPAAAPPHSNCPILPTANNADNNDRAHWHPRRSEGPTPGAPA